MFYHILAVIGYIYVIYVSYSRSQELRKTTPHLGKGWFFGRNMDLSDQQWVMWRSNMPLLFGGLLLFSLLSYSVRQFFRKARSEYMPSILFYLVTAVLVVFYIHGFDIILLFGISFLNYWIAKMFGGSKLNPILCWLLNVVVIFSADYYRGYDGFFTYLGLPYLESFKGAFAWNTYFKISMLRHISFNMDYYWMINQKPYPDNMKTRSQYAQLEITHQPSHNYGILQYFAYIYYVPLFLAGPVISFNAWMAQVITPQTTYDFRKITWELVKVLIYTLGMEIFLHFIYSYAFNQYSTWKTHEFPSAEVCITAYWTLNFMYTKFLIIWRFFRVMALYDGIDTPENMHRCVNNNYTFVGFWRSWHGSLNKWIVRYLYVPLGGSKTIAVTVWIIFTFIGLWHDLLTRWLAWAWCNCVFFTMEIIIVQMFSSSKFTWLHQKPYWRHIVAAAGVLNIYLLMLSNLAILHGFTNTPIFLQRAFFGEGGLATVLFASAWLFCGVIYMNEIRYREVLTGNEKKF